MSRNCVRTIYQGLLSVIALITITAPSPATDLSGNWSGYWVDCRSGHRGPLRATLCKCDDGRYRAVFVGRFWRVLPFRYSVVLDVVQRDGDKLILTGDSNLGLLFGTFHYSARADATDFVADYTSRRYEGQFVLKRCGP